MTAASAAALVAGLAVVVVIGYAYMMFAAFRSERERRGGALPVHVVAMGSSYLLLVLVTQVTLAPAVRTAVVLLAYALGAVSLLAVASYERRRFVAVRSRRD